MKNKVAIATALLTCQLIATAAFARGESDKRIDTLLQAPLQKIAQNAKIAQLDAVPNGLPYVPPTDSDNSEAPGASSSKRKGGGHGKRSAGHHKRGFKGQHRRSVSSALKHRTAIGHSDESACCAPANGGM